MIDNKHETVNSETLKLMPHQQEAVDHCLMRKSTLVAYDIGTGKTAVGIHCLHPTKQNLIVCPASLVENWKKELLLWKSEAKKVDIVSYNKVDWTYEAHTVIYDEAHLLKNPESNRSINCKYLSRNSMRIIGMTATPVLNRIEEIKNLLEVLGAKLPELTAENLHLHLINTGLMIRVKAADVLSLPEPVFKQMDVELSETEEIIQLQNEIKQFYENSQNNIDEMWRGYRMELIGRLMKIRKHVGISKIGAVIEQVNQHLENNPDKSIIIFGHHKQVLEAISKTFDAPLLYGKTSFKMRHKFVEEFQSGKHKVIVCSIQAAGVGLTLTNSHNVIFVEFPWTPAEFDQAYGRSYRKGQTESVNILELISNHRVDQRHQELLASKRLIVDAITDGDELYTTNKMQKILINTILDLDSE